MASLFAQDQKEDINQQIIDAIQCKVCERDLKETKLYECSFDNCTKKNIYCKSCGNCAHIKIKTHKWKEHKKEIHKNDVNLDLVKSGYVKLDLMIKNKGYSGWKETGGQMLAYASGTAVHAAKTYQALLFAGNAAKVNGQLIDLAVDVVDGVKKGSDALKAGLKKATPWAIVAAASIDIIIHSYRFWTGDIESWQEFGWYCTRSVTSAAASGLSGWGGANIGIAVGTAICPGAGTIVGGIIGSLLGSILGGTIASKGFDKIWPNPNQKKRERIVREAVSWFHFSYDKIFDRSTGGFNENEFNKDIVMKKYRRLAKMYHPDRKDGDLQKWNELQVHLGILLALCEKNPTEKNEAVKCMKAICL